jgi:hypothetical protein
MISPEENMTMQINSLRKTHPIVLILAVAITVFSLLLSAAITGLIPGANFIRQGSVEQSVKKTSMAVLRFSNAGNVLSNDKTAIDLPIYKNRAQSVIQLNSSIDDEAACASCGEIVSINMPKQATQGYVIRVRMENGSYRTITQYSEPHFNVGDEVKLNSTRFTLA